MKSTAGTCLRLLPCLLLAGTALAYTPEPFTAEYEASYSGLVANARRQLVTDGTNRFAMSSVLELKLFGNTVTSISENSLLEQTGSEADLRPLAYDFVQTGIGSRNRQVTFHWDQAIAVTSEDDRQASLTLPGLVTDNLSAFLEIRRQLHEGREQIVFDSIEKGELKTVQFNVLGEEVIKTPAGSLSAVRLEKVREPGSDRHTHLWLAPALDYLLVRLVQDEPDAGKIRLDLKKASVNGRAVPAL